MGSAHFLLAMGTTGKARRLGKVNKVLMPLLVSWLLADCFSTGVSEVWVKFKVAGPGEGQETGWPRMKDKPYEFMGGSSVPTGVGMVNILMYFQASCMTKWV